MGEMALFWACENPVRLVSGGGFRRRVKYL